MGGSSKDQTVGHWYVFDIHFALCASADALLEFRGGDATAWSGEIDANAMLYVNKPRLWGGEDTGGEGGIVGAMHVMFGQPAQSRLSGLTASFGPGPAYRGKVTLFFDNMRYGAYNPYPKPAAFKLRRIYDGWRDESPWYPGKAMIPIPACDGRDPYTHVTSPPYPVYARDDMGVATHHLGGAMYSDPIDELNVSSTSAGGILRPVLQQLGLAESIDVSSVSVGGALLEVKKSMSLDPEMLDVSSVSAGGDLDLVLLRYENYDPEGLDVSSVSVKGEFL